MTQFFGSAPGCPSGRWNRWMQRISPAMVVGWHWRASPHPGTLPRWWCSRRPPSPGSRPRSRGGHHSLSRERWHDITLDRKERFTSAFGNKIGDLVQCQGQTYYEVPCERIFCLPSRTSAETNRVLRLIHRTTEYVLVALKLEIMPTINVIWDTIRSCLEKNINQIVKAEL